MYPHIHVPPQCYNKIDQVSMEEVDRLARESDSIVISCEMELNLDILLSRVWDYLSLIRVYTKKRGGEKLVAISPCDSSSH